MNPRHYQLPTTNHQLTSGFTLMEILIVIALIAILAGVLFMGSIQSSYQKTRDVKRKQDLSKMVRKFEDYYNDTGHYPPADPNGVISGTSWGSAWTKYADQLPQDPLSPNSSYFYQTNPYTQNFFALYAKLENISDDDIKKVGCSSGCGPNLAYNYVVTSPNVVMYAGTPSLDAVRLNAATGPTPTPSTPPGAGCNFNQCGFCSKCGGVQDCGYLSRCWYDNVQWLCKFDLTCL